MNDENTHRDQLARLVKIRKEVTEKRDSPDKTKQLRRLERQISACADLLNKRPVKKKLAIAKREVNLKLAYSSL